MIYSGMMTVTAGLNEQVSDLRFRKNMQTDERVQSMPAYPEKGCIAMPDDVLVVKLGRWHEYDP